MAVRCQNEIFRLKKKEHPYVKHDLAVHLLAEITPVSQQLLKLSTPAFSPPNLHNMRTGATPGPNLDRPLNMLYF